ncbi:hypothetical protein [Fibrobacter sp.]|uniref:hypothetical protein n=1 Tax=Fibrobacter sp. TaxID=35828 RepID=UPI00386587D5
MTKLFNKFLTISVAAFSALSLSACSDKIAGTAEEPNQIAQGTESSSSAESSNSSVPSPTINISSSSESERDSFDPITINPTPSSSSKSTSGNGGSPSFGNPDCHCPSDSKCYCGSDGAPAYTLDDYLKNYNITDVSYDENVLAFNKTYDGQLEDVYNSAKVNTSQLRSIGLHKITRENLGGLGALFLKASVHMGGMLYEKDGVVSRTQGGCQLYVLNVYDTSPVIHVLTEISKDTIKITDVHDNCDYEPYPFEMHVGFLFEYCGELSESPKIDITFKLNESMKCGTVDYDEYINKKLK